jgi:SAM-dependent MidA family methyltransferase
MQLPTPSDELQRHSLKLTDQIHQLISKRGGWISFAQFMHMALYQPGLGYYVSGLRKFGAGGDFVTAPEISPLFSRCLAQHCIETFEAIDQPSILEFGAGSGVMAADILLFLEEKNSLPEQYLILEISPDLQQRQKELLQERCPHLLEKVQWLNALPKDFCGVVLANEVLDAMPVHLFENTDSGMRERGVVSDGEGFSWGLRDWMKPALDVELAAGYQSEINLALKPWLADLSQAIEKAVVVLIDYGFTQGEYYHPQRHMGTLMCHYRHLAHPDPLVLVGLQDITAHVDFTAVENAAVDCGFEVSGFMTQAEYLMGMGLLEQAKALDAVAQYEQAQAMKTLLMPGEMGELFKVIVLEVC